jgi:hypothetical protein
MTSVDRFASRIHPSRNRTPRASGPGAALLLALGLAGGWACSGAPEAAAPEPAHVGDAGATAEAQEEAAAAPASESAGETPAAQPVREPALGSEPTPAAQPVREPAPSTAAEAEPSGDSPAPARPADPTVILIERAEPEKRPRTLFEAAEAARAQRAKSGSSARISVTDKNLHEFQGEGLTFAEAKPAAPAEETAEDGAGAVEPERGEAYWRARVRDLRLRLREAVDELAELEERAGSLRRSFYAEDDPYVRDGEIKPAWDRVLDRTAAIRQAIGGLQEELGRAVEEGRLAGALPGWLREGIELEPEPEELPKARERSHEPAEPEILDLREPPGGG